MDHRHPIPLRSTAPATGPSGSAPGEPPSLTDEEARLAARVALALIAELDAERMRDWRGPEQPSAANHRSDVRRRIEGWLVAHGFEVPPPEPGRTAAPSGQRPGPARRSAAASGPREAGTSRPRSAARTGRSRPARARPGKSARNRRMLQETEAGPPDAARRPRWRDQSSATAPDADGARAATVDHGRLAAATRPDRNAAPSTAEWPETATAQLAMDRRSLRSGPGKVSEEFGRLLRDLIAAAPPRISASSAEEAGSARSRRAVTWDEWRRKVEARRAASGSAESAADRAMGTAFASPPTVCGTGPRTMRPRPHPLSRARPEATAVCPAPPAASGGDRPGAAPPDDERHEPAAEAPDTAATERSEPPAKNGASTAAASAPTMQAGVRTQENEETPAVAVDDGAPVEVRARSGPAPARSGTRRVRPTTLSTRIETCGGASANPYGIDAGGWSASMHNRATSSTQPNGAAAGGRALSERLEIGTSDPRERSSSSSNIARAEKPGAPFGWSCPDTASGEAGLLAPATAGSADASVEFDWIGSVAEPVAGSGGHAVGAPSCSTGETIGADEAPDRPLDACATQAPAAAKALEAVPRTAREPAGVRAALAWGFSNLVDALARDAEARGAVRRSTSRAEPVEPEAVTDTEDAVGEDAEAPPSREAESSLAADVASLDGTGPAQTEGPEESAPAPLLAQTASAVSEPTPGAVLYVAPEICTDGESGADDPGAETPVETPASEAAPAAAAAEPSGAPTCSDAETTLAPEPREEAPRSSRGGDPEPSDDAESNGPDTGEPASDRDGIPDRPQGEASAASPSRPAEAAASVHDGPASTEGGASAPTLTGSADDGAPAAPTASEEPSAPNTAAPAPATAEAARAPASELPHAAAPPRKRGAAEGSEPVERPREALLRHIRRAWLGPAFKRAPHTVMVASVRLDPGSNAGTPAATLLLARAHEAVGRALGEIGEVYAIGEFTHGLLLSGRGLPQAERIAETLADTVKACSADDPGTTVLAAAGLAALHRDEDPTTALCLAEHCLWIAELERESSAVSSNDPRVRQTRRRWSA